MSDDYYVDSVTYRTWQMERECDKQFARVVPVKSWDYFAARLKPLADDAAAAVRERLFAGVGHPFHYLRAKGWMGELFRGLRRAADYHGLTVEAALAAAFAGTGAGPLFVLYHWVGGPVYAAEPEVMLDCLRRGWLGIDDTFLICAESTPAVALYWEGSGPYFGKRGDRRLAGGAE